MFGVYCDARSPHLHRLACVERQCIDWNIKALWREVILAAAALTHGCPMSGQRQWSNIVWSSSFCDLARDSQPPVSIREFGEMLHYLFCLCVASRWSDEVAELRRAAGQVASP